MRICKLLLSISLWFAGAAFAFAETKIRVGHFPNITHAQGVVAHALSRQGKGWFEQRLGPGTKIEWFIYNAGPSAMEAIFASSIDLTYVGPGPALNAYTKSDGKEIRLIAGAANGGAGLVVQPDANLKTAADFRGKKIATPQLGNTQDISCRAWLTDGGLRITQLGGDAQVIPTQNPDQLGLFKAKRIDGVWTVEPWLGRLEQEASGKVIVEEKDVATTILVSSVKFLKEKRDLAKKFAQAHAELTDWISKNPEEAQRLIKAELLEETKSDMSPQLIVAAWKRIVLTAETPRASVEKFMQNSVRAGFIKTAPDLSALFPWLNTFGNVMFGLKLKPGLRNRERREVAKFFLHLVGLEKFMEANVHQLSGGMKQRVALARALAPNPRVLLMDEPFAALDAMTREQLYGDIQRIWQKRRKTIIFVTHNVREAACLADRVMIRPRRAGFARFLRSNFLAPAISIVSKSPSTRRN